MAGRRARQQVLYVAMPGQDDESMVLAHTDTAKLLIRAALNYVHHSRQILMTRTSGMAS
jgi:hypothetical protein